MTRNAKGDGLVAVDSGTRLQLTGPVEATSYRLLGALSIFAIATILLGRLIPPLGEALHQVAQFLVR
jgi:hypothetical protein